MMLPVRVGKIGGLVERVGKLRAVVGRRMGFAFGGMGVWDAHLDD
jgi:hypothetical protein